MTGTTSCPEVFSSLEEANAIKGFLDANKFQSLEITQFADVIFIRPKGDSLKFVKILERYVKIQLKTIGDSSQ